MSVPGFVPRKWLVCLVAALAALAMLACAAAAEGAITLRDSGGHKLAAFASFQCQAKGKTFKASSANAGWKLTIEIQPFGGYKPYYHVGYGTIDKVEFFARSGATTYSNTVEPPNTGVDESGEGGQLGFPGGGGGRIGLGFGTAFQIAEPHEYASLGGLAGCT